MKHIHRLMVTSTAYRQTSERVPLQVKADPDNILLGAWRPRRHEGEVVRDSVLAISGKLNRERFGPPAPVSQMGDGAVETKDDPAGNRRSVYLIVRRSQHLTMLDLFDTPMMEVNCPERTISTVPLQALAMLHGPFMERNARAFADRILKAAASDDARLDIAFRLAFAREPRDGERKLIQRYLAMDIGEQKGTDGSQAIRNAWTQVALVLFNSNEFLYVH